MDFERKVGILVAQATPTGLYYSRQKVAGGLIDPRAYIGKVGPGTYVCTDGTVELFSEPARLLQQVYVDSSGRERQRFVSILLEKMTLTNARVIARTLAAIGEIKALRAIKTTGPVGEEFWRGLIHALRFEPSLFGPAELENLETEVSAFGLRAQREVFEDFERTKKGPHDAFPYPVIPTGPPGPRQLHRAVPPIEPVLTEALSVIARLRYLRLAAEIRERRNPALDVDRQVLLSRMAAVGFSEDLSAVSNEIEAKSAIAVTDIDFKSVMDLLRSFYETFTKEACAKVEAKTGVPRPVGNVSQYGPYAEYLRTNGLLGEEEWELLGKLYRFLSNQGAHRLGSKPEQLRVAHATVIEWCMLISGRIQAFML